MIPNEKVAGAGADMAADQDVPLQADHHQPGLDEDNDDKKIVNVPVPQEEELSMMINFQRNLFRCPVW